ncbi:MAG: hypothetical protein ACOY0T_30195 [Myxococcota bacterium]
MEPLSLRQFGMRQLAAIIALLGFGCSGAGASNPTKTCDTKCQAEVAARGVRETLKLAYNLTLNGKPVGMQDASHACLGGDVRVFGEASSNPEQGSTHVELTYTFNDCAYRQVDSEQEENYDLRLRGDVHQSGVLTVQPTAPTALIITSESLEIEGSVFDPPLPYDEPACRLELAQSGNKLSGTMCGQPVGVSL